MRGDLLHLPRRFSRAVNDLWKSFAQCAVRVHLGKAQIGQRCRLKSAQHTRRAGFSGAIILQQLARFLCPHNAGEYTNPSPGHERKPRAAIKRLHRGRRSRNDVVDMRLRPWLLASIGLNLMLVAAWYIAELQEVQPVRIPTERLDLALSRIKTKTNVVVRSVNITWSEIASTNLSDYILNLRAVGCPEPTIRDIIVAGVNQIYACRGVRRKSITPDQQWWRSDSRSGCRGRDAAAQFRDLENDRRAITSTNCSAPIGKPTRTCSPGCCQNYGLTGPRLGDLSPETKQAVYDIVTRTIEELKGQNPMDTARIWQNERLELAALLPPDVLNEYLLRYSPTARRLRDATRGLALSPEQFQSLFAEIDPIVTQPDFYYQGTEPESRQRQQALQGQYDEALKQGLGAQNYASLQLSQDPLYLAFSPPPPPPPPPPKDAAQQAGRSRS